MAWPSSNSRELSRSWWVIVAATDLVVAFWGLFCLGVGIVPTYIALVD